MKPSTRLLVAATRLTRPLVNALYAGMKTLPLHDRVVMITRRDIESSVDFETLERYLARSFPRVQTVALYHPMRGGAFYVAKLLKELYYLATSRWVVTDSYQISISFFPVRPSVRVAQIWHALGAIKQFGRLTVGLADGADPLLADAMQMHRNYSFVCAPSNATAEIFARAFGVARSQVRVIGSPRIDYLLQADRQEARRRLVAKYGLDQDRPIYLYAPTFRNDQPIPVGDLAAAIRGTGTQLLVHTHSRDRITNGDVPGVTVCDEPEVLPVLTGVDGVITDYSAVIFEAGILGVPCAVWAYDVEEYRRTPGFALPFEDELSDVICRDPHRALEMLDRSVSTNSPQVASFMARYIETADAANCQRLTEVLGIGG